MFVRTKNRISAIVMLSLLTLFTLLSAATLIQKYNSFAAAPSETHAWYEGAWITQFETWFEKNVAARDIAIDGWGGVRYGLFDTGNQGVVVGRDGWLFTNEEFIENADAQQREAEKLEIIDIVQTYLRLHNIELMVAFLPAKARLYSEHLKAPVPIARAELYDRFHPAVRDRVALSPNLYTYLGDKKEGTQIFMKTDTHWSPDGASLVAHHLADIIRTHRPELIVSDKTYMTLAENEQRYSGDLNEFIPTGVLKPVIGPRSEPLIVHKTSEVAQSDVSGDDDAAMSLFGDEQIQIVLAGTSYSYEKDWNFEGALRQAFGVDVLNVSDEGKGPIKPMIEWLKEADLRNNPPKLVIWEIPERFMPSDSNYDMNDIKTLLKQAEVGEK